jgi:hypothetical protein
MASFNRQVIRPGAGRHYPQTNMPESEFFLFSGNFAVSRKK